MSRSCVTGWACCDCRIISARTNSACSRVFTTTRRPPGTPRPSTTQELRSFRRRMLAMTPPPVDQIVTLFHHVHHQILLLFPRLQIRQQHAVGAALFAAAHAPRRDLAEARQLIH